MKAAGLNTRVAFDPPLESDDNYGGTSSDWDTGNAIQRWAKFRYNRGSEGREHGRATGTASYKIKIHKDSGSVLVTTDWRLRSLSTEIQYNITEIDRESDPRWIWIVAEAGEGLLV